MKQKPVWRMNIGDPITVDRKPRARVLFNNGELVQLPMHSECFFLVIGYPGSVAAYETARTKRAKYKRVDCGKCDSTESWDKVIGGTDCINCNGKGYRLEAINHAN